MEKLAILGKLAELLGAKHSAAAVLLACTILLVADADILNEVGVADLVNQHRQSISIAALVLFCLLAVKHLVIVAKQLTKAARHFLHSHGVKKALQTLAEDERETLKRFIATESGTMPLNILDQCTDTLTAKGILRERADLRCNTLLARYYSLTPTALAYLRQHSHAFR